MSRVLTVLRETILWSYERGTWQYDALCVLILTFVFLTPRQFYRDWPVINNSHLFGPGEQIVFTLDEGGKPVLNVSTRLVPANLDAARLRLMAQVQLQKTLNRPVSIANIKPILGENGETIGYSIWLDQGEVVAF